MAPEPRSERLDLRIAPSELAMVRELAEAAGLSVADIVRTLIRREHAEKFPPKKRR